MNGDFSDTDLFRDMFLFTEVAKQRSFSRAAASLQVSLSQLSRRLAAHEKKLGLQLLQRTTRKVELTEAGALYFARCQRLVDETRELHEYVRELAAAPKGRLRILVAADLEALVVAPLLPRFAELYREITLECEVSQHPFDLASGRSDLTLRLGEQPDSSLRVHPLTSLRCHVYAAPGYLQRRGTPKHPSALSEHECVRFLGSRRDSSWSLQRGSEKVEVAVRGRLALGTFEGVARQVAQGMGVGLIADLVASEHVRGGRLVQILKSWSCAPLPVVAVTPTQLLPARARVLLDFLRIQLAAPSR
jgi:DNA-binding transcriptional LysR family regulator